MLDECKANHLFLIRVIICPLKELFIKETGGCELGMLGEWYADQSFGGIFN